MQGMADLVQVLVCRLLDKEADSPAGLPEIGILRVALVPRREGRAHTAIPAGHQLGRACLQGIAVGGREKALDHQETIASIGGETGSAHWTTRCMSTGLAAGAW